MNKHAFMIMAHGDQILLEKLLQCLDDERNDIYLHIDAKSNLLDTNRLRSQVKKSQLHIYSKIKCYWGDVSLIKCELYLLEMATAVSHQYYHLISGADFPLKSMDEIHSFFDRNSGKEFIFFSGNKMDEKHKDWYLKYHLLQKYYRSSKVELINDFLYIMEKILIKLQGLVKIKRRKFFKEYYKGSQWFSITEAFAKYILTFHNILKSDFRLTFASDEMILPTLVMNSSFKDNLYIKRFDNSMEQNLRYIIFKEGIPKTLDLEDYDAMISSGCIFGRKFSGKHMDVIDMISDHIMCKVE